MEMNEFEQRIMTALTGKTEIQPVEIGGMPAWLRTLRMSEMEQVRAAFPDGTSDTATLRTIGYIAAALCDESGNRIIENAVTFARSVRESDPIWGNINILWDIVSDMNFLNTIAIEEAKKNWSPEAA